MTAGSAVTAGPVSSNAASASNEDTATTHSSTTLPVTSPVASENPLASLLGYRYATQLRHHCLGTRLPPHVIPADSVQQHQQVLPHLDQEEGPDLFTDGLLCACALSAWRVMLCSDDESGGGEDSPRVGMAQKSQPATSLGESPNGDAVPETGEDHMDAEVGMR